MDRALMDAVAQSHFIMGPQVKELEARLAEYVGAKHCISCANGTDALDIALKIWDIGPGDAVFVPDFTFFSTAEVVALEGATPIFVDVCADSFNIDPDDLERAIAGVREEGSLRPAAVIAVDLFGLPADYARIRAICGKYGLKLLEDGAQGFGGEISGAISGGTNAGRACSFGDISTTSFFPAKPLGCYGDGGAIFTDNDEWASLADSIRVHGKGSMKYDNVRLGLNSRLDTVQAAVLQVKLDAFPEELAKVNRVAALYGKELAGVARTELAPADDLALPQVPEGFLSSWAQYTIRTPRRDELQQFLKDRGIPAMIYYIKPLSAQKAFEGLGRAQCPARQCPVAARLSREVLSLPMHPYMTPEEVRKVCGAIREFFGED